MSQAAWSDSASRGARRRYSSAGTRWPRDQRSHWSTARTAAICSGRRRGNWARKAPTSGRWPWRPSDHRRWSGAARLRAGSDIERLVQAQFGGNAGDGAGQLLAAALGGPADLAGDVGPLAALGAQVG